MVANQKVSGRASSLPAGLALGGILSLLLTIILAVVTAKLVDVGSLPENNVGYAALLILLLASALGSAVAVGKIKRRRLLVCLASGAVYYGELLAMTALFFGGRYTGMGVTALVVSGGMGLVCLAGMRQGRGQRKRRSAGFPR